MTNIFEPNGTAEFINRIEKLTPETKALWGKMDVAQMLAHCNVTYEMIYDDIHKKPNAFAKLLLKLFVKKIVVTNDKPYSKNSRTAPEFVMADRKKFEEERKRLIAYLTKTQQLGANYFEGKESRSFGALTAAEWNVMFSKHLDHHFSQFGV